MNIEQQVVNLELSKRLKELGVKQESLFYWIKDDIELRVWNREYFECCENEFGVCRPLEDFEHYSAFTVAELGEIIQKRFNEWAQGWCDSGCFYHFRFGVRGSGLMINSCGKSFEATEEETEADARAALIIHLIENNLLKL